MKTTFENKFGVNITDLQLVILLIWHYYICCKFLLGFVKQKFNGKNWAILICIRTFYLTKCSKTTTEYLALD